MCHFFRSDHPEESTENSSGTDLSTSDVLINSIVDKDKELRRLIHEKQVLLLRLINLPSNPSLHPHQASSSLEAITFATSYRKSLSGDEMTKSIFIISCLDNQLMQIINQASKSVDLQSVWTPIIQLGEQLTTALVKPFLSQSY